MMIITKIMPIISTMRMMLALTIIIAPSLATTELNLPFFSAEETYYATEPCFANTLSF